MLVRGRGTRPRLSSLEAPKYNGSPPKDDNVESVMSMASTSGNSSGTIDGAVAVVSFADLWLNVVDRGKDSSHPALSSSFVPAYSTRVQEGTGDDSHSNGLSSSLLMLDVLVEELGCLLVDREEP